MALFTAINEVGIATLVDRFYERVRVDDELGDWFNATIHDWKQHRHTLRDFWSSMMLRSHRYHGKLVAAHRALPPFPPAFFHRWLALWRITAQEVFAPPAAELFIGTAERIAQGLSANLGHGRLVLDKPSRVIGPLHITP